MTEINKDSHYKRVLGLLRMVADKGAPERDQERETAGRKLASSWAKSVSEAQISPLGFIEWMMKDQSFINNLGTVDIERIQQLFLVGMTEAHTLTGEPIFESILAEVHEYYYAKDEKVAAENRRLALLTIVMFEKTAAEMNEEQSDETAGQRYMDRAQKIIENYALTRDDVDKFNAEREDAILELYQAVEEFSRILVPSEKERAQEEINQSAEHWGLLRKVGGVSDYTEEFTKGWNDYLINGKKDQAGAKRKAAGIKSKQKAAQAAAAAAARATGQRKVTNVHVFPVRDANGKPGPFVGGIDFRDAVEKIASGSEDFSLTVDFPLDGLTITGKNAITILLNGGIDLWALTAKELTIKTRDLTESGTVVESTFRADKADIQLGASMGAKIFIAEEGTIDSDGPMEKAVIEFGGSGRLAVNDKFIGSTFRGHAPDARVDFQQGIAEAIGSHFIGCLPMVGITDEMRLKNAYTKAKASEVLSKFEEAVIGAFKLGVAGFHKGLGEWSPLFANPHFLSLSDEEALAFHLLMTARANGWEGNRLVETIRGGSFAGDANLTQWESFYATAKLGGKPISILINPLFPNYDDFAESGRSPNHEFYYRFMFITGEIEAEPLAKLFAAAEMEKDGSSTGYQRRFFEDMKESLERSGCEVLYSDVLYDTTISRPSPTEPPKRALEATRGIYAELKAASLDDLFKETMFFYYLNAFEEETRCMKRDKCHHVGPVFYDSENNGHSSVESEMYSEALAYLDEELPQPLAANDTQVVDGATFKHCGYTGEFEGAQMIGLDHSRFDHFIGEKLTLSGNWEASVFAKSKIKGRTQERFSLDRATVKNSQMFFTKETDGEISFSDATVEDGDLRFRGYETVDLHKTHCSGGKLSIKNSDNADLSGGIFENCEIKIKNVGRIIADKATFINCTFKIENADSKASDHTGTRRVYLNGASLVDTTFNGLGALLEINDASIIGTTVLEGSFDTIEAKCARLGSDITSADTADWMLDTTTVHGKDMELGNIRLHSDKAFGTTFGHDSWSKVSIVGGLIITPDAKDLYNHIHLARNYVAEHEPIVPNGGLNAKEFSLTT